MLLKRTRLSQIKRTRKKRNAISSHAGRNPRTLLGIVGYALIASLLLFQISPFDFQEMPPDGSSNILSKKDVQQDLPQENHINTASTNNDHLAKTSISSFFRIRENTQEKQMQKQQRICFLAGPHKAGSTSIQTNLWRWTIPVSAYNFTDQRFPPLYNLDVNDQQQQHQQKPIVNWIWPVPPFIVEAMKSKPRWQPGKAFYPLLIALTGKEGEDREVPLNGKSYSSTKVIDMYRREIQKYWDEGHDIVFGTEAMDRVTVRGEALIERFSQIVLPKDVKDSQVTVVVTYRTPKINHLISTWHEQSIDDTQMIDNIPSIDDTGPSFHEWVLNLDERVTYKHLNALGMVNTFLEYTDWNVALVDLRGLEEEGWESSSFIACEILGEECDDKIPLELKRIQTKSGGGEAAKPMVLNVKKHRIPPNMSRQALDEMDFVLTSADCRNLRLLLEMGEEHRTSTGVQNSRLRLHHPVGMKESMEKCNRLPKEYIEHAKDHMIKDLMAVALRYGKES